MKTKTRAFMAISLIALSLGFTSNAQTIHRGSYKTTDEHSRSTAHTMAFYNGAIYAAHDSTIYLYTTGRGYDVIHQYITFDTSYQWNYDTATSAYIYNQMTVYLFDANGNYLNYITLKWDIPSNSWLWQYQNIRAYDASHNCLSTIFQSWNTSTGNWINTGLYLNSYGVNNNLLTSLYQSWNTTTSSWENNQLNTYTYDDSNNRLTNIFATWNSGTWVNNTKDVYTYNAANKRTQALHLTWNIPGSSWANHDLTADTYDAGNRLITEVRQTWDSTLFLWKNNFKLSYTWNAANDAIANLYQNWDAATFSWKNSMLSNYTYDLDHNQLSYITQMWNPVTTTWINSSRIQNEYNSFRQNTLCTKDSWNTGGYWEPVIADYQIRNYYETYFPIDVATIKNDPKEFWIHPSPANDILNVNLLWNDPQTAEMAIIDLNGRLWQHWQIPVTKSYQTSIPLSQLPAGTYIIKVSGEKEQASTKFTIVH